MDTTTGSAASSRSRTLPSGVGIRGLAGRDAERAHVLGVVEEEEAVRPAEDHDRLVELCRLDLRLRDLVAETDRRAAVRRERGTNRSPGARRLSMTTFLGLDRARLHALERDRASTRLSVDPVPSARRTCGRAPARPRRRAGRSRRSGEPGATNGLRHVRACAERRRRELDGARLVHDELERSRVRLRDRLRRLIGIRPPTFTPPTVTPNAIGAGRDGGGARRDGAPSVEARSSCRRRRIGRLARDARAGARRRGERRTRLQIRGERRRRGVAAPRCEPTLSRFQCRHRTST